MNEYEIIKRCRQLVLMMGHTTGAEYDTALTELIDLLLGDEVTPSLWPGDPP